MRTRATAIRQGTLALALASTSALAFGGEPEPALPILAGIAAGRSPMSEVRKKFGPAREVRVPRDESTPVRLCFRSAIAGDGTTVVFESGPTGSYGETVTAFAISGSRPAELRTDQCAASAIVRRDLKLSNGLSLGDSEPEIARHLGTPTRVSPEELAYRRSYARDPSEPDRARFAKVMGPAAAAASLEKVIGYAWITISLREGRIASVTVSRVEEWQGRRGEQSSVPPAADLPRGSIRVPEVTSKEVVDLLAGLTTLRDCSKGDKFCLRLFLYRTDGECPGTSECGKDQLLVLAATFDEYPEKRAFRLQLVGGFKRVSVLSTPKTEEGAFALTLYTESAEGRVSCGTYSVSLAEMRSLPTSCP